MWDCTVACQTGRGPLLVHHAQGACPLQPLLFNVHAAVELCEAIPARSCMLRNSCWHPVGAVAMAQAKADAARQAAEQQAADNAQLAAHLSLLEGEREAAQARPPSLCFHA